MIFLKNEEPGVGNAGFENCTETGVGNAGFKIYNLLKPAMGMPALPLIPHALLWLNFSKSMYTTDFLFSVTYIRTKLEI